MKPVVLFAVLNWGLGHASRSIPIINSLLRKDIDVVLCSDGIALELLQKEYPQLKTESLPSYNISYKFESIVQNILWHLKDILAAIAQERKTIENLKKKHNATAVISDNRYGCYFEEGFSVFISHQLSIQSDPAWKGKFASNILNKFIARFNLCWIPDFEGKNSLAGKLSENNSIKNKKYLGCLSRFNSLELAPKYKLAMILSGPEPARSKLEALLVDQTNNSDQTMVLVRGSNDPRPNYLKDFKGEIIDLCLGEALNNIICESESVICRAGYSSIMDLKKIGKKAILIPTPGQTEQEYLAKHLMEQGVLYQMAQNAFSLKKALAEMNKFNGFEPMGKNDLLVQAVEEFVKRISIV